MSECKVIIETERLMLRGITQEDFHGLCEILKDPAVMYAYEGTFSDQEVQQWLDKQLKNYADCRFGLYMVILKSTGLSIGQCGITMQKCADTWVHEIGIYFKKRFGIMDMQPKQLLPAKTIPLKYWMLTKCIR